MPTHFIRILILCCWEIPLVTVETKVTSQFRAISIKAELMENIFSGHVCAGLTIQWDKQIVHTQAKLVLEPDCKMRINI